MVGDPRRPHVQHQNKVAFKHNKASRKTAKILSLPNEGLCSKCHDIIEWRKRFRKYKSLSTPRKCQICDQKTVTRAYHNICDQCACDSNTCAKCRESKSIVNPIITPEQEKADMQLVRDSLSKMTERARRTFLRHINANKKDNEVTADEDENYWAPEEEIDFVKAAKYLRELEAQKEARKVEGDEDEDEVDGKEGEEDEDEGDENEEEEEEDQ